MMGMYAVLYRLRRVRFFYQLFFYFNYVTAPALLLLPAWIANELLQHWLSGRGVAYMAHLGGLLTGASLMALVMLVRGDAVSLVVAALVLVFLASMWRGAGLLREVTMLAFKREHDMAVANDDLRAASREAEAAIRAGATIAAVWMRRSIVVVTRLPGLSSRRIARCGASPGSKRVARSPDTSVAAAAAIAAQSAARAMRQARLPSTSALAAGFGSRPANSAASVPFISAGVLPNRLCAPAPMPCASPRRGRRLK